jgi:outer membrane immunogenic protein
MAEDEQSWTGFYLGVNAGGTWGNTSNRISATTGSGTVTIPPGDVTTINGIGANNSNELRFVGGGTAGYNYQMGQFVLGLETDFDSFSVKQSRSTTFQSGLLISPPVTYTIGQRVTTDWLWTVRPRIGWAMGPLLLYGTGGMAMTPIKLETAFATNRVPPDQAVVAIDKTKTGWTAGVGGAWMFMPHLSAKLEWLYSDFGSVHGTATTPTGFATITSEAKVRAHLIRMGVDYRF